MAQTDGFSTPEEVAQVLRTSAATVRRWASAGRIEFIRLPGGQVRIPSSEVERLSTPHQRPDGDLVADAG